MLLNQQKSRKEEHKLTFRYQDSDDTAVNSELHPEMTVKAEDVELPTIAGFVLVKSKDAFCDQMKELVGTRNCLFIFDKYELLVRQVLLDGSLQKLVPNNLRSAMLYLAQYSTSTGPARERQMYDSLRHDYYWPSVASHACNTMKSCTDYSIIGTKCRHLRKRELYPRNESFEFVAISILEWLSRTGSGNQFVVIITDSYSKLTRPIPTTKIT